MGQVPCLLAQVWLHSTHCDLEMSYGIIELIGAWLAQAIAWAHDNYNLSSIILLKTHLNCIIIKIHRYTFRKSCFKNVVWKRQPFLCSLQYVNVLCSSSSTLSDYGLLAGKLLMISFMIVIISTTTIISSSRSSIYSFHILISSRYAHLHNMCILFNRFMYFIL